MRQTTTMALAPSAKRTIIWSTVFVAANVLLPQLFHTASLSGQAFLPIMLFTITAAILFGARAAIATAIISPLVSMLIFGMPTAEMTALLIIKGVAAAAAIAYARHLLGKVTPLALLGAIAAYQVVGIIAASLIFSLSSALEMALISWPAVLLQLVVGYIVIRKIAK